MAKDCGKWEKVLGRWSVGQNISKNKGLAGKGGRRAVGSRFLFLGSSYKKR